MKRQEFCVVRKQTMIELHRFEFANTTVDVRLKSAERQIPRIEALVVAM